MSEEIRNLIKSYEMELLTPEVRKSPERLKELLADDFFEFMQNGERADREELIKALPDFSDFAFNIKNFEAREIADDTFLVSYVLFREFPDSNEELTTLCSSIWQEKDDRWQMIFFQGTPTDKDVKTWDFSHKIQ